MGNYFFVYIIIQQHFYTAAAIGYNKQVSLWESTHTLLLPTHHLVVWLAVKKKKIKRRDAIAAWSIMVKTTDGVGGCQSACL